MKTLFRLFIKNADDTTDPAVRNAYGKFTGIFGIASNAFLFFVKVVLGIVTNSISVTADAVNVCIDCAIENLSILTGEKATQTVVDEVFKNFCVGK